MRNAGRVVLTLLVGACALLGLGCTDDDPDGPSPEERTEDLGAPTGRLDLGAGLSVAGYEGWTVTQQLQPTDAPAEECGSIHASLDADGTVVAVTLPAAVCAGEEQSVLNGEHGDYVGIDDVPGARDIATTTSGLGEVTTFEQTYTECTNECVDSTDRVALVALTTPAAPDRPTLMVRVDADDMDAEAFAALVDSLADDG